MKTVPLTVLLLVLLSITACSGEEKCSTCELEENNQDTLAPVTENLNTTLQNAEVEKKAVVQEMKENHEKIVQKYGEQWDFCTCVVKNDSINDAFEKGGMTPKQEEQLMARWEYVDSKCKELLTTPNTTPEERARHDKKVLKCLKANGLKR